MKTKLIALFFFGMIQTAQATTCNEIREKAYPPKNPKAKAACILLTHTPGMGRGSSDTVYSCGAKKFTLHMTENSECTVTTGK